MTKDFLKEHIEFMGVDKKTQKKLMEQLKKELPKRIRLDKKPTHYPKPKYCKCNKGHTLFEVYNEKTNAYDWDCPVCINMMKREREKEVKRSMATEVALSDTLDIDSETEVWT